MQTDLPELVDAKETCRILGGSRPINHATLYRGIRDGRFPQPIKLGGGTSRSVKTELLAVIRHRMTARGLEAADREAANGTA
jgi:predicted DNA-binding transcriptional regulator AlpA